MTHACAVFSPCRAYRYELWRHWDANRGACVFIGLNPSTADETMDDPTIRKCISYAMRWGYGSLCMVNLFALRSTDPRAILKHHEPIGHANDRALRMVCRLAEDTGIFVAAWGRFGFHLDRARVVASMFPRLHCLAVNKDGSPTHPLYQSLQREAVLWTPEATL